MASASSPSSCMQPERLQLLHSGLHSFLAILATHVLAGEVDTLFPSEETPGFDLHHIPQLPATTAAAPQKRAMRTASRKHSMRTAATKRYFNPVNLCWRYYSIVAFRLTAPHWGPKQLAIINFEAHPYHPPTPYVLADLAPPFVIKRLEISGLLSGQGLLSILAAYQGLSAFYFIFAPQTVTCLPTLSKPLAVMGLFRVMVSKWVANKVYIEPFSYPDFTQYKHTSYPSTNTLVPFCWAFICFGTVFLSIWPIISHADLFTSRDLYVDFMLGTLYQYFTITNLLFHVSSLLHGPHALANRILYFNHWTYKAQTWGFVFLLLATFMAALIDFLKLEPTDFLIQCIFSA